TSVISWVRPVLWSEKRGASSGSSGLRVASWSSSKLISTVASPPYLFSACSSTDNPSLVYPSRGNARGDRDPRRGCAAGRRPADRHTQDLRRRGRGGPRRPRDRPWRVLHHARALGVREADDPAPDRGLRAPGR